MTLHSKGETQGKITLLWRINKNGFYEEIWFHGNLNEKPKGWHIKLR